MPWTMPRTWVTGELLTSGQLNTYIRDNTRYLKGLDGSVELDSTLSVPALFVAGQQLGGTPESASIPANTSAVLPADPIGATVVVLASIAHIVNTRRWQILARVAIEIPDSGDGGNQAVVTLRRIDGGITAVDLDQARPGLIEVTSVTPYRIDLTLAGTVGPGDGSSIFDLRVDADKTGGSGHTRARPLSLTAYPLPF